MANSKKPRKKRYNEMAHLVRHAQKIARCYYISNVINIDEMNDKDRVQARTLTHLLDGTVTSPSAMDMYAISKLRHRWSVQTGIVCRDQTGKVYFDKVETMNLVEDELDLTQVKSYISKALFDAWEAANPLNKLTMYWLMSPIPDHDFTYRQTIAPLYYTNALNEMLTRYERDNPDHLVQTQSLPSLDSFITYIVAQS